MTDRLDIGIASYQSPGKLKTTIEHIEKKTESDYRLLIVDNNSPDPQVRQVIERAAGRNDRIVPMFCDDNTGYSGAVNKILEWAETPQVAYLDNDAYIETPGWDTALISMLMRNHELQMVFPNGGANPIKRPDYLEVLWGVGFCWILNRQRYVELGGFDEEIGHQEEVDFQTRLRLDGWKVAADPAVSVKHDATSSKNPESRERIAKGVQNWVNKWAAHFGGKGLNYHSPNVIRFADWPVISLYLEEYYKEKLPDLNKNPETVVIDGQEMDLIRVPKYKNLYRNRII